MNLTEMLTDGNKLDFDKAKSLLDRMIAHDQEGAGSVILASIKSMSDDKVFNFVHCLISEADDRCRRRKALSDRFSHLAKEVLEAEKESKQ